MTRRLSTIDLLAREFATAVARGDNDQAEGWLAMAQAVNARRQDRRWRGWRMWTTSPDRTAIRTT